MGKCIYLQLCQRKHICFDSGCIHSRGREKIVLILPCCLYCACGWNHITSSESCNTEASHGKCSHGNPSSMLSLTKGHHIYGRKQETSQRKPEKQNVFTVTFGMKYNKHFLKPVFQPFYFFFLQWMELRFNTLAKCPHCKKM